MKPPCFTIHNSGLKMRSCTVLLGVVAVATACTATPGELPRDAATVQVSLATRATAKPVYSFGPASPLIRSDGSVLGATRVAPWPGSVAVGIVVSGLAPGTYRLLIHSVGRCDTPDFASAGPKWGLAPADLGNHRVGSDGRIYMSTLADGMRLRASDPGDLPVLLDADGAALIFHAAPGGGVPDPTAGATRRVACAVLK